MTVINLIAYFPEEDVGPLLFTLKVQDDIFDGMVFMPSETIPWTVEEASGYIINRIGKRSFPKMASHVSFYISSFNEAENSYTLSRDTFNEMKELIKRRYKVGHDETEQTGK